MMVLWIALAMVSAAAPEPAGGRGKKSEASVALETGSGLADEDLWVLAQARDKIFNRGNEEWSGDVASGIKDAPAIPAADPVLRELEPLLRSIIGREPAGIAPRQTPDQIPQPWWRFAWWDVDGDDKKEIVLAAGTSPAPYYAVFQRAEGGQSWRILHEARLRFLGSASHSGRAYFFGVFDGYGVASPVLAIDSVATNHAAGASKQELRFDLREWPAGHPGRHSIAVATTARATKLRTAPRKDDKPTDNGMGGEFPGNLFQTLAPGSTGWTLDSREGRGCSGLDALLFRWRLSDEF